MCLCGRARWLQNGVLGLGHEKNQQPQRPSKVPGILAEQISAGWKHSAAVMGSGRLFTWGWGGSQGRCACKCAGGLGEDVAGDHQLE
jgi:alpha-tubulin suppressor-like RCC1 family protein